MTVRGRRQTSCSRSRVGVATVFEELGLAKDARTGTARFENSQAGAIGNDPLLSAKV